MKKKVEKENANYKNAQLGVDYTFAFLEKFEHHELRNRYMHLEYKETEQARDVLSASNPNVVALVDAVGEEALSIKEMMERLGIKHRPSFLYNHLRPAISEGYVAMLYPDKPKHPCQKYLLTTKGVALRRELDEKMS